MKKIITCIVFTLVLSPLFAQQSAIKFQVGYGLPLGGSTLGTSTSQGSGNNPSYTQTIQRGSFGSGTQIEIGYVHSVSGLLSVQMDASYLFGKEYNTSSDHYTYQGSDYGQSVSSRANVFLLSPQLRAKLGEGKLSPYLSAGPVVSFGKMYETGSFNNYDSNPYNYEKTYSGSAAIGAKTTVGVEMTQGKFGFYGQVTMINLSYAPTKGVYTKYVDQYGDRLANMTTAQKETSFVTSYDANAPQDPNQPSKALKQYNPLGSISLSFGVMYHF
ncbi:MAG: hypothetical protein JST43_11915 [Bacteroidetes bacterium]|nr:hypothetical protein [Bacteroidota bacterium]MBS1541349.1 hypothetical protein [Bacteroidota bacterium]